MQFLKKTLGYYFKTSPDVLPPGGEPYPTRLHPEGCQENDLHETSPTHPDKEGTMSIRLTANDSALNEDDVAAQRQHYISRFVNTWQDRQEHLTLNKAAIQKAEREWEAEQERERRAARELHPQKG
jgi:hypothetical protein